MASVVGDDDHWFCLQVGGGIGLNAVRPGAGPLCDVGQGNAVAPEFPPHGLDPAIENAGPAFRVTGDRGAGVDVDQRHRLRRVASGGVGKSGHGREKGFEALYGFSALKTVAAWHG